MEHWELIQKQRGNIRAAEMARILREQFGDVPFPSAETSGNIKRFSSEQRAALEKQGYRIYGLTGQSIKTLRDAGRKFWSTWHEDHPDFEGVGSMQSEVAIKPTRLFLPESNNKAFSQQEEMVHRFSQDLAKKVPGVQAIIGDAADYVELAFQHLDATNEYLFGANYNYDYDYARTKTPTSGSHVALVGHFHADDGLRVLYWGAVDGYVTVHAVPLVMPV